LDAAVVLIFIGRQPLLFAIIMFGISTIEINQFATTSTIIVVITTLLPAVGRKKW
jgi:hypothetical protein